MGLNKDVTDDGKMMVINSHCAVLLPGDHSPTRSSPGTTLALHQTLAHKNPGMHNAALESL